MSEQLPGYVYVMKATGHCLKPCIGKPIYKIGRSKEPEKRLRKLRGDTHWNIELLHTIPTNDMVAAESHLHDDLEHDSLRLTEDWWGLDAGTLGYLLGLEQLDVARWGRGA